VSMLPMDIQDGLRSRYGKNLHNRLKEIVNDIVKDQGTIHVVGDKKVQEIGAPMKVIRNSGRGLRCGYYAMGAGILQLPESDRDRVLGKIGCNHRLRGNIDEDQYVVGDQLFRYSIQHNEIFTGAVQSFVNTMVAAFIEQRNIDAAGQYNINELNNTIIQIQNDVVQGINIYADRIQILGRRIGINCYINGRIYGGEELGNALRIDIYNPQGGHYECVDLS